MSDDGDARRPRPRTQSTDEKLLDELIFRQDLNEVHLLMDYVCGRADRSLLMLTMPDPENTAKTMTCGEIVEAITKMRYPPDENSTANARNAAILLMAKDRLSALADPARGVTIAYTTMFIGAESKTLQSRIRDWFAGVAERRAKTAAPPSSRPPDEETTVGAPAGTGGEATPGPGHDTRIDLATRTYPRLRAHARRFRYWRDGLAYFTVFWLLLTALAYWDAGLGRSALERLDQNWKAYIEARRDTPELVDFIQGCDLGHAKSRFAAVLPAAAGGEATKAGEPSKTEGDIGRTLIACNRLQYLHRMTASSRSDMDKVFACREMSVLHVWCWHWLLSGNIRHSEEPGTKPESNIQKASLAQGFDDPRASNEISWQAATSILTVFTTYVLPMMFALLGTLIGSFRSILNRIRDNELAPRDLVRMKIGVPTGLVAGIAVGLFLSPTSVPVQGAGGVAGELTLTASGLGFLAGYASQSFFRFLDNLRDTVFPENPGASASGVPPNAAPPNPRT